MKTNELKTFNFNSNELRVITGNDGEPWFIAKEVCAILEITNVSQATGRLDDDEKGIYKVDTLGGSQQLLTINESGLYSLTITSNKPEAKKFKKWITSEVLPSIRKTGSYSVQQDFKIPNTLSGALLLASKLAADNESLQITIDKKDDKIAVLEPKAQALDRLSGADSSMCLSDAAKNLGVPPRKLNKALSMNRWIFKRSVGSHWVAHEDKRQAGYLEHKPHTVKLPDGKDLITQQVRVTANGLAKLAVLVAKWGV